MNKNKLMNILLLIVNLIGFFKFSFYLLLFDQVDKSDGFNILNVGGGPGKIFILFASYYIFGFIFVLFLFFKRFFFLCVLVVYNLLFLGILFFTSSLDFDYFLIPVFVLSYAIYSLFEGKFFVPK